MAHGVQRPVRRRFQPPHQSRRRLLPGYLHQGMHQGVGCLRASSDASARSSVRIFASVICIQSVSPYFIFVGQSVFYIRGSSGHSGRPARAAGGSGGRHRSSFIAAAACFYIGGRLLSSGGRLLSFSGGRSGLNIRATVVCMRTAGAEAAAGRVPDT